MGHQTKNYNYRVKVCFNRNQQRQHMTRNSLSIECFEIIRSVSSLVVRPLLKPNSPGVLDVLIFSVSRRTWYCRFLPRISFMEFLRCATSARGFPIDTFAILLLWRLPNPYTHQDRSQRYRFDILGLSKMRWWASGLSLLQYYLSVFW